MISEQYVNHYRLLGQPKSFIIRSKRMNNVQAWQWASCDAGARNSASLAWEDRENE